MSKRGRPSGSSEKMHKDYSFIFQRTWDIFVEFGFNDLSRGTLLRNDKSVVFSAETIVLMLAVPPENARDYVEAIRRMEEGFGRPKMLSGAQAMIDAYRPDLPRDALMVTLQQWVRQEKDSALTDGLADIGLFDPLLLVWCVCALLENVYAPEVSIRSQAYGTYDFSGTEIIAGARQYVEQGVWARNLLKVGAMEQFESRLLDLDADDYWDDDSEDAQGVRVWAWPHCNLAVAINAMAQESKPDPSSRRWTTQTWPTSEIAMMRSAVSWAFGALETREWGKELPDPNGPHARVQDIFVQAIQNYPRENYDLPSGAAERKGSASRVPWRAV